MTHPRQGTPEWRELRKRGIGGSDIAILAGLTQWSSPYRLYLEKRGEIEPEPPSEVMTRGNILEEPVARWWSKVTGQRIRRRHAILQHPAHPWARASVDREVVGCNEVLEVKTSRRTWDHGVPPEVDAQVQWYLGIGGYRRAHVAALLGDLTLDKWVIEPDPTYFRDLLDIGEAFWRRVEEGRPPEVDGAEATRTALTSLHPSDQEPLAEAGPTMIALAEQLRQAIADKAEAEQRDATIRNAIRAMLGASAGVEGPGWRITWKRNKDRTAIDWAGIGQELAAQLGPRSIEVIDAHTKLIEGVRVLRPWFADQPAQEPNGD